MTFRITFRRKITWICLVAAAVFIKVFSFFPDAVEHYYSRGIYPIIARTQRALFGWVPFSIGDLVYGVVFVVVIVWIVRSIRKLRRGEAGKGWGWRLLRRVVVVGLWVYVLFNLLWGLNYDRLGIADQLQLQVLPYHTEDLGRLTGLIVKQLNALDTVARANRNLEVRVSFLRAEAVEAYDSLAIVEPQFAYQVRSVKASLFSYPGLYIGFAGYYNPFTGEAQVNIRDPPFTLPYTACHEMGHQLGYAKENEANFIGFLACRESPDPAVRYSTYLDLYGYAVRELYFRDSALALSFRAMLNPGVRQDLRELQRFDRKYANPLEPVIWRAYSRYLRANRQPQGVATYSEVTAWLIAFEKKYGWDEPFWRRLRQMSHA
jgi:Protein of unknown function (DUF3810)